jgi:hypothetical protein
MTVRTRKASTEDPAAVLARSADQVISLMAQGGLHTHTPRIPHNLESDGKVLDLGSIGFPKKLPYVCAASSPQRYQIALMSTAVEVGAAAAVSNDHNLGWGGSFLDIMMSGDLGSMIKAGIPAETADKLMLAISCIEQVSPEMPASGQPQLLFQAGDDTISVTPEVSMRVLLNLQRDICLRRQSTNKEDAQSRSRPSLLETEKLDREMNVDADVVDFHNAVALSVISVNYGGAQPQNLGAFLNRGAKILESGDFEFPATRRGRTEILRINLPKRGERSREDNLIARVMAANSLAGCARILPKELRTYAIRATFEHSFIGKIGKLASTRKAESSHARRIARDYLELPKAAKLEILARQDMGWASPDKLKSLQKAEADWLYARCPSRQAVNDVAEIFLRDIIGRAARAAEADEAICMGTESLSELREALIQELAAAVS